MASAEKVVLITGAAGVLGRALAQEFLESGARLIAVDRDAHVLSQAYPQQVCVAADLTDAAAARAALDDGIRRAGRVDALCNIAGGFACGAPVHETSADTWRAMLDINVHTLLHTVQAVVPQMLAAGSGAIVNVGSGAGQHGLAQMGAYCAAKSAVIRLTESMSAELRERGINVNCVLPSIIDTPANRAAMPDADASKWVTPQDLARVIVFLCSPAARAIHGAALPVTGLS